MFRQLIRYGRGRIRMLRKHPETFAVTTLLPAVFLAGCLTGWLLALAWPPLLAAYLGVLVLYASIVLLVSLGIAQRHRDLLLVTWLPLVFVTVHFAAGAGLLLESLQPRRAT